MIRDVFSGLVVILICIGVGAGADWMARFRSTTQTSTQSLVELLSWWFLFGAGISTLLQLLLSNVGISLSVSLTLLAGVGTAGLYLQFIQRKRMKKYHHPKQKIVSKFDLLFWGLICMFCVLFFMQSISRVTYTWDSIAFWTPKMVSLSIENRVNINALIPFNHPEYPLQLPLTGADAMIFAHGPNEIAAKSALFGYTLAMFGIFGTFLRKYSGKWSSIFWLLLLATCFIFREHVAGEYAGTADIVIGIYLLAGTIALISKRPRVALLLWLILPWVKSEGLVFAAATSGMMFLLFPKIRIWILAMGTSMIAPWRIFIRSMHVDSSQYFQFGTLYARPWVAYATYSVHAFREEFRNLSKWNLIFFFFFAETGLAIKHIVKDRVLLTIYTGLALQLLSYLLIFTITPEEQASFIASSVSRLTLHLAPTAVLMASYLHAKSAKNT